MIQSKGDIIPPCGAPGVNVHCFVFWCRTDPCGGGGGEGEAIVWSGFCEDELYGVILTLCSLFVRERKCY